MRSPTDNDIINILVHNIAAQIDNDMTTVRNRCIMTSVIGAAALRHFCIDVELTAVDTIAGNKVWFNWMSEGVPPTTPMPTGAWSVAAHHEHSKGLGGGFPGHLVLTDELGIIDLDLGQFARPEHDLLLPPAKSFDFDDDRESLMFREGSEQAVFVLEHAVVTYHVQPSNDAWVTAPDNDEKRFRRTINRIIDLIEDNI